MNGDEIAHLPKYMACKEVSWPSKTNCHGNEVRLTVESAQDLLCIKGTKVSQPRILFSADGFWEDLGVDVPANWIWGVTG